MGSERASESGPVLVSHREHILPAPCHSGTRSCATFFHGSPKLWELRGSTGTRVFWRPRFTMRSAGLAFSRGEPRRAPLARNGPRLPVSRGERWWREEAGGRSLKLVMTHLRQITTRVALCASLGPMRLLLHLLLHLLLIFALRSRIHWRALRLILMSTYCTAPRSHVACVVIT